LVSEWRKLKETLQHWPPEIGKLGKIIPLNTCIIYINIYHLHDISWKHITKKMAEEKSPGLLSHPFLVSHHLTTSPWRPLLRAHPALAAGRLWVRRITAPGGGAFCGRGCLRNPTLDHGNHGNHKPQNTSRYGDMDIRYIYIYHISFMLVPIGIEYGDIFNGTKCYVYIYTPSHPNAMFNMVFVQKTMFDWGYFLKSDV
jgi:hypothetical protein